MFLVIAFGLGLAGSRVPNTPTSINRKWTIPLGVCILIYALVYPHFLVSKTPWLYLVAAPVGLVPCPTLSLVLGFGLILNGFHSRAWKLVAAAAGFFYSLFGIFILGVWLDAGLFLAATFMLILATEAKAYAREPDNPTSLH